MKLSLDALKEKAEVVASEVLMNEISGGIANSCHNQCHGTECYNQLLK